MAATFVLIPGGGGNASYWAELAPELQARGHDAVAVDLRQDDPALGLSDYATTVEAAITEPQRTILVAQSLGGFTAPMVRKPVRMIVLLNAMVPLPGERPGEWWGATGSEVARRAADEAAGRDPEFDIDRHFLHDIPPEVMRRMQEREPPREPADTLFGQPCEFTSWPDVPIKVLVGRDDRFFPAEFQRTVARERLDRPVDEIPGGHCVALSNAPALADRLAAYAAEIAMP